MDGGRGKSLNFAAGKHMICNTYGYSKNRVIQKTLLFKNFVIPIQMHQTSGSIFWDVFIV